MTISQTNPDRLAGDDPDRWGPIVQVDSDRRSEAVARLVADGPDVDVDHALRFLEFARQNGVDLTGMWARLDRDERIRSTVLIVPNPGRTAMVFATRVGDDLDIASTGGLISHACEELADGWEIDLAQVLSDPADERDQAAFRAGGFHDLARLSYLERPLSLRRLPETPEWPDGVRVEPYEESRRGELLAILDASYEQTLDCPGLRGLRRTEDILTGHMATGLFDAPLWTLLYVDDEPAGALLLNPAAQGRSVELVYLGLAPIARRRGLGTALLRHGLHLLRPRREKTLMLAVDDNNTPALRLYHAEGFGRVLRRVALIRPITA
jgi:ribosomal protein S18 acetylase RimI-like enzyme